MRIAIVAVGRLKDAWVQAGCDEYGKRVRRALPFQIVEAKDDVDLARKIPARHKMWALDERGLQLSSLELADSLRAHMNRGEHGIALVIGGADGLPPALVERADFVWSLGRLTLPHRLARLIVTEQVYRALSIVRGEPYHRP
jgi:23S rRNA (pseudouridine1915-N3)-methyltransferase